MGLYLEVVRGSDESSGSEEKGHLVKQKNFH